MATSRPVGMTGNEEGNRSANNYCRLLYVMSCVAVTLVCGVLLIVKYLDSPIRTQVDISYNQTMPMPTIVICPTGRFNLKRVDTLWHQHFDPEYKIGDVIDPAIQYQQLADVMDVMSLWNNISFDDRYDMITACYQGRGIKCDYVGYFRPIYTASGTCLSYYSGNKTLTGYYYGIYMRVQNRHLLNTAWKVSFHETWSDVDVLEVGRHSIKVETVLTTSTNGSHVAHSDYLNVMLVPKQFIRMDRPKQLCDWQGSDHVVACRNECFERAVTSVTGCKLPFMKNERVPYCSNSSSVTLAEELSEKLITDGVSGCYCLHSCNEVSYRRFDQVVKQPISFNVLKVYYNIPLWRTVREVPVYNGEKFICDIGSLLCLILGASVLSLFECCEWFFTQLRLNRHQIE